MRLILRLLIEKKDIVVGAIRDISVELTSA